MPIKLWLLAGLPGLFGLFFWFFLSMFIFCERICLLNKRQNRLTITMFIKNEQTQILNMNELALIDRTVTALRGQGLDVHVAEPPETAAQVDVDAWVCVGKGAGQVNYVVEVKRTLGPATLGAATLQLQHMADATGLPGLLVTDHVTPPMAARLREQGQQFADVAGNAYLEGPGLLVYVTGRKLQDKGTTPHAGKAHTLTGLKVMFALLCDPELANAPHRAIAGAAGVALGGIPAVLADLQQAGHLLVLGRRRRLHAAKRLLDEWALAYARRLRGKTLQATYAVKDFDTWQQWQLEAPAWWGGEPAANRLVDYLKPGVLTIYAEKLPPIFQAQHQMRKVRPMETDGRVLEWRKPFWGQMPAAALPGTVPPVLVYADLLATGDARCMETAKLVYDEHLARLLPAA